LKKKSESYDIGKQNEFNSWTVLKEKGYVKLSKEERKDIINTFSKQDIIIKPRGFDCVKTTALNEFKKDSNVSNLVLYELKTAGKERKKDVSDKFKGLGFTLTSSEKHNADILKDKYKFIFLNLKNNNLLVCNLEDFFDEKISRIYSTWSIFIEKDI